MDWSSFSTAQQIDARIRAIVGEELRKQRPAARYAVVNEILDDERAVMATFIGEDTPVRIPYLDVKPATVGQEVRVTGVGSDRVIDGIRGTSDTEARAADLEAESQLRSPRFCEFYRGADASISSNLVKLAWPVAAFPPVGFDALAAGETELIIPESAYYRAWAATLVTSGANFVRDLYINVVPASGAAAYDMARSTVAMDADGMSNTGVPVLILPRTRYLQQGDKLAVYAGAGGEYSMAGGIRTFFAVEKVYGGPQQGV